MMSKLFEWIWLLCGRPGMPKFHLPLKNDMESMNLLYMKLVCKIGSDVKITDEHGLFLIYYCFVVREGSAGRQLRQVFFSGMLLKIKCKSLSLA